MSVKRLTAAFAVMVFSLIALPLLPFKTTAAEGEGLQEFETGQKANVEGEEREVVYSYTDALKEVYNHLAAEIAAVSEIDASAFLPSLEKFIAGYLKAEVGIKEYLSAVEYNISEAIRLNDTARDVTDVNTFGSSSGIADYILTDDGHFRREPHYDMETLNQFLSYMTPGNIIYEDVLPFGHTAIICEPVYVPCWGYYVETIEAVPNAGVTRGYIDMTRIINFKCSIMTVEGATTEKRKNAIDFCRSQLGKPYTFFAAKQEWSPNTSSWYCSEIVWAAYYRQNINLDRNILFSGIMPKTLMDSPLTSVLLSWENL